MRNIPAKMAGNDCKQLQPRHLPKPVKNGWYPLYAANFPPKQLIFAHSPLIRLASTHLMKCPGA